MKRQFRLAVVATIAAATACATLAGCGGGGQGTGSPGTAQPAGHFTYWSMWKTGEAQQTVLADVIQQFTKDTGITVDVQWTGRDVASQVVPRLNAGNPPDLVDGSYELASAFGEPELRDLNGLYGRTIDGESQTIGQVLPAALKKSVTFPSGKTYMAPYEIIGVTMWYNALATPSLVQSQPKTWADFISTLDQLKAAGRTPVALDGDIADYDAYWLNWALMRAGGIGTLANAALDPTGTLFNSEPWVRATSAIEQLITGGYLPAGFNGTKFPTQQSAWADQTSHTDVILMGSWLPSEATQSLTQQGKKVEDMIQFHSFPFPAISSGDAAGTIVQAEPEGFVIPAKAKNADAAEQFIAYFMNKARLGRISSEAQNLTPRSDVNPPAALKDYAAEYATATAYSATNDGLVITQPQWLVDVWQPTALDFFGGKLTAEQFRSTLADKTVKYHQNR